MKRIIFVLVGLLFVGVGIWTLKSGNELAKRCTQKTTGTVVEIIEEKSIDSEGHNKYKYYPVIRYQVGNKVITKKGNSGFSNNTRVNIADGIVLSSSHSKYKVNDSVEILYNPDNVEEFIIKGDRSTNLAGIIPIVLGSLAAILGIFKKVE